MVPFSLVPGSSLSYDTVSSLRSLLNALDLACIGSRTGNHTNNIKQMRNEMAIPSIFKAIEGYIGYKGSDWSCPPYRDYDDK